MSAVLGQTHMSSKQPGDEWRAFVRNNGSDEFSRAFADNAVLEASVLQSPCVGASAIASFFAATSSGMYDTLRFTTEVAGAGKTLLEWEGQAFGEPIAGSTIVTRNLAGLIQSIRIYHRPLSMVVRFSAELSRRLPGKAESSV